MNISETEAPLKIVAKTCGCREKNRRTVRYQFIDSYPTLCLDKKDLILTQLEACERFLEYVNQKIANRCALDPSYSTIVIKEKEGFWKKY
jgi:hypothetical protein